jgi:hypothetical protein
MNMNTSPLKRLMHLVLLLSKTQTTPITGPSINLDVVVLEILLEYVEIANHLLISSRNAQPTAATVVKELDILQFIVLCKPHDVPLAEPVDRTTYTETALIISATNAMNKVTLLSIALTLFCENRIRHINADATPMK